jgi:NAD(P)-dependent dehydrogenase (short-subunit alcohol dehydrogenase family)
MSSAGGLTVPGLDGAAVIVTGGGSGIGAATARQLGLAGAAVVLVGRRERLLKDVAGGITADGGRALCVPALDYLTQTLAGELAPLGVRVNGISPGPIDTPIHATWADDLEEAYRWLGSQVPLGRIGAPEEVALWITLLLSPAAAFMTGAVIPLDGGQVIDRE